LAVAALWYIKSGSLPKVFFGIKMQYHSVGAGFLTEMVKLRKS